MPRKKTKKTKKVARCLSDLVAQNAGLFKNDEFDAARRGANMELLRILTDYLYKHPTIRFSQALSNLDMIRQVQHYCGMGSELHWVNEFNLEPMFVLRRVKEKLNERRK